MAQAPATKPAGAQRRAKTFCVRHIGYIDLVLEGKGGQVYWYNPKTRSEERVPAPVTDSEAIGMLGGHPSSGAFIAEYERRREEQGMEIEQALIFVGHHFRLHYLLYQPVG